MRDGEVPLREVQVRLVWSHEAPRRNALTGCHRYLGVRKMCGGRLRYVAVHGDQWLVLPGRHTTTLHCAAPSPSALPKRMKIASEQYNGKANMGFNGSNQTRVPKRQDLTRDLLEALKGLILEGEIVPGTRLPSERVLAKRFGVARPSLRQALKVLDVMGIVHPRVGDGTYLDERPEAILRQPIEFLMLLNQIPMADLFEARLLVEPSVAARAAERATARDLAAMEQTIERLRAAKEMAAVVEADKEFHKVIFSAAGNQICRWFFAVMHEAIVDTLFKTSPLVDVGQILALPCLYPPSNPR